MVLPVVNTVFKLYTRKLYTKKAVSSYDICYYQLRTMSYLNVYFFTRESHAKKGGLIIYCRASLKGKRKDFSLGKTIPPNLWDKKKAFPNKKLPEGKRYYDHLKTVEKEMYDAELKCIKNSKTYSLERIIDYYQGLDKQFHGIVELFNKHQIQFKQLVAVNQRAHRSYIRYDMCLRHLCNYLKEAYNKTDLDVRFLDYPFIQGLDHYIRTIGRCSNNTTVKYIQCFKKIVRTAIHNRVIDRDPFIEYKGRIVTVERECLNDTELKKLASLELKDEKNPDGDIEIIFTGLRPGEKLYEELLIGDKVSKTPHKQILRAEEDFIRRQELEESIKSLMQAEEENDVHELKKIFKNTIHGYTGLEDNVDVLSLQGLENQKD